MIPHAPSRRVGLASATSLVIANMIGTGVFTSLGFQLMGISDPPALLMLWVVGGIAALCGALTYGELGAAMPRSGGEYHYLSKIYHPVVGFCSGWISMTLGFAAPVALAGMAFGSYANRVFPAIPPLAFAVTALVSITMLHCAGLRIGLAFQNTVTIVKVLLVIGFIACGLLLAGRSMPATVPASFVPTHATVRDIFSPSFAVSLIFVSYSFSGWNAAAYVAGEIEDPAVKLPLSLWSGTALVTVLYVLLNFTFLKTAPAAELRGQLEVGYVSAHHIFGPLGGDILGTMVSLLLVSSVSAMVFVGPRLVQVMGEDMAIFRFLAAGSSRGIPLNAILFQSAISLLLILTSTFEKVLTFVGFTLNVFTFLAVLGVFVHRRRFKDADRPYKTWGYPVVPAIFLVLLLWTQVYLFIQRPAQSLAGTAAVLSGLVFYALNRLIEKSHPTQSKGDAHAG
jgi:basic amino acid/polyamine antiporter, APA family